MCDTLVKFHRDSSLFGKNSDRHPQEIQYIHYCSAADDLDGRFPEEKPAYLRGQFQTLLAAAETRNLPYRVFASRPSWIWGAEMGVNERGVAIGNEAVFSTVPPDRHGLLGMDILRLALHASGNAFDALQCIISLIQEFGQGGNGAYTGSLHYSNSFLIHDGNQAYILESAGRRWAWKQITEYASISNAYTLEGVPDGGDEQSLKQGIPLSSRASRFHLLFTKGLARHRQTNAALAHMGDSWSAMREVLTTNQGGPEKPDHSMRSICMDTTGLVTSRTTGSLICAYNPGIPVIWATGAPLPMYMPYVPFPIPTDSTLQDSKLGTAAESYQRAQRWRKAAQAIVSTTVSKRKAAAESGRAIEHRFEELIQPSIKSGSHEDLRHACNSCIELADKHAQWLLGECS